MVNKFKKVLALYGGKKARTLSMPTRNAISRNEKKAVIAAIDYYDKLNQDPPYDGVFQKKFESNFCNKMGGGYAVAVSTGSVACFIGIRSLNLPKNSEVIISPVTDSGSLFAIMECGLKPVMIDSSVDSFNTSWRQIKQGISSKTSAIFLVHCSGNPLNIKEIKRESKKFGLKIIEDCSQAPFAIACRGMCFNKNKNCNTTNFKSFCKQKYVGSYGDVAVFSTMYRKNLQTGGSGGVVFTKNLSIYKNIISESDRGRPKWSKNYNSRNPGQATHSALNHNTDELSCSIGIESLKKIDVTIKKRMKFIINLTKKLDEKEDKLIFKYSRFFPGTSPFLLPILIKNKFAKHKPIIAKMLLAEGIDISPSYECVISEWEITKKYNLKVIKDSNAKKMKKESFNLFLNENYTKVEVNNILDAFSKISNYFQSL